MIVLQGLSWAGELGVGVYNVKRDCNRLGRPLLIMGKDNICPLSIAISVGGGERLDIVFVLEAVEIVTAGQG
jgi:hypothetical protein